MLTAPISQPPLQRLVMTRLPFVPGISAPCGTALVCARLRIYAVTAQSKVFELKGSRTRLLENSMANVCICAFSHLSVPYACCY